MSPNHVLPSALLIGAIMSGCSDSGPNITQGMISWTDNGTQHSVMATRAALVINELEKPPLRTFFITPFVSAGAMMEISALMNRQFTTGDYRCDPQATTERAEILYGLSTDGAPPPILDLEKVQDCLVTIHHIGVNYGGVVDYTLGTFSGTIVVGTELHELSDGRFSAPTLGLSQND